MPLAGAWLCTGLLFGFATAFFWIFTAKENPTDKERWQWIVIVIGFGLTFACALTAIWTSLDLSL